MRSMVEGRSPGKGGPSTAHSRDEQVRIAPGNPSTLRGNVDLRILPPQMQGRTIHRRSRKKSRSIAPASSSPIPG